MKAQSWKNVRARAVTEERVNETHVQEVKQRMMHDLQAQKLAELRRAAGLNQQELAERLGMTQTPVSPIERGELERTELSTLRAFVQALGGKLEVVIQLEGEQFTLN